MHGLSVQKKESEYSAERRAVSELPSLIAVEQEKCSVYIANCLLKWHPEHLKQRHKDEHSSQLFALTCSTCIQWDCIPMNTVAGKSVSAAVVPYNTL